MNGGPDLYEVLGVRPDAAHEDIVVAYRQAVKIAHPDAGGASHLFRVVTWAYEVLSDPIRRADYDLGRQPEGCDRGSEQWSDDRSDNRATRTPALWPMAGATPDKQWDASDSSLLSAISLAAALEAGWRPQRQATNLVLQPGEAVWWTYGHCTVDVYCAADVDYWVHAPVWRGGVIGLAAKAHAAARNANERDRARRRAAQQWRPMTAGAVSITPLRLVVHNLGGAFEFWHGGVTTEVFTGDGVVLQFRDGYPVSMRTTCSEWLYVALKFAAWRQIHRFPVPTDLLLRARAAGAPITAHVTAVAKQCGLAGC